MKIGTLFKYDKSLTMVLIIVLLMKSISRCEFDVI
jgi:hypothetical protein